MTFSRLVFMKCKADKSEHHQDGSSSYQPVRIFHAEPPSRSSFLRLEPQLDQAADGFGTRGNIVLGPPLVDRRQLQIVPAHADLGAPSGGRRPAAFLFRGTLN